MTALKLKKMYPKFWKEVESSVLYDMQMCMPQNLVEMSRQKPTNKNCRLHRVAHNAAFSAVSYYHKYRVR